MSVEHYENFPVASWLCPPHLRPAVQAIYHFARTADDIADEGDARPEDRLSMLERYRSDLRDCHAYASGPALSAGSSTGSTAWPQVFAPLQAAIAERRLPLAPLDALLDAFAQDTGNPRYPDRPALLAYCRRSANPVGRLLLHLQGMDDAASLAQSDAICTALQLINFWQDLSVDLPRGRHYVPEADAARHDLSLNLLPALGDTPATAALVHELCGWAGALMAEGAPLACRMPGRLGWELRFVVQGGLRVLERIAAMGWRTLRQRPVLGAGDVPVMAWRALRMRSGQPTPGYRPA